MSASANPLIRKMAHMFPLTAEEQSALESAPVRIVELGRDEDIVRDGERPKDCNLLLEGWVYRYKILNNGKRQILSFQFPGDIFDAQSFILEQMDHAICTITPCKVAVIPHRTMLQLTDTYPRITRAIWKDTLVDAAVFREWLTSVGRRDAPVRIAHLICEIFIRLEVVGLTAGKSCEWPLTQTELGDALGLSAVHVNRSLMKLRGENLITLKGTSLTIDDWEGLKRFGEFEAGYLHMRLDSDRADHQQLARASSPS